MSSNKHRYTLVWKKLLLTLESCFTNFPSHGKALMSIHFCSQIAKLLLLDVRFQATCHIASFKLSEFKYIEFSVSSFRKPCLVRIPPYFPIPNLLKDHLFSASSVIEDSEFYAFEFVDFFCSLYFISLFAFVSETLRSNKELSCAFLFVPI